MHPPPHFRARLGHWYATEPIFLTRTQCVNPCRIAYPFFIPLFLPSGLTFAGDARVHAYAYLSAVH